MGGGNSKVVKNVDEDKDIKKENKEENEEDENEESGEESDSLEKIKEENEEEEKEDGEKKQKKNEKVKNIKNNTSKEKISNKDKKSKKSIKITNSVSKKKKSKDDGYFSIKEEESSNELTDKKSSIKESDLNFKLSDKSSFIDARQYNTKSSFQSLNSAQKSDNTNSRLITTNSNILGQPISINHNYKKANNTRFGEFNYINTEQMYEEMKEIEEKKRIKEETESEESESLKFLTLKEKIENEYQRHKKYLDTNEKCVYSEINKKSYKNAKRYKYRKSLLLHEKEITCICSLSGKIKKIAYATSSLDKSIKLWNAKFVIISQIKGLEWHSNFVCEFDTTNILSSESIYIKMYDLMSDNLECIHTFRDHIEDINSILPLIDFEEEKYIFISGGKDKHLRLWDHEIDTPIKYYEGHYDIVTHIQKIGNNNKKIISCSRDKTFIIWDIKNSNPLKVFNNYFNHLYLLGDNVGFCCGAYDNKIRFYDDEYLLKKCLVSELYGIKHLLMIDDYYILTVDINNNINILDLYENNLMLFYTGCAEEVVSVIKSFNWNLNNSENKIIISACKDGYVYLYSFESGYDNKKDTKEKKIQKKEKIKVKKSKNKTKDKDKTKKDKDKDK